MVEGARKAAARIGELCVGAPEQFLAYSGKATGMLHIFPTDSSDVAMCVADE